MDIHALLGDEAESLLDPRVEGHPQGGPAPARAPTSSTGCFVHDRPLARRCCATCSRCFDHGRLGGTGYVSILPVDQGIEHSAAASFAPNPQYFDPANIVELAIEGGCNAVATTFGVLGAVSRQLRPPDPVHREAQPQRAAHLPEQVRPDHVRLGRAGLRPRRGRRRRHDLLRLRRVHPPDPGGQRGLRRGPRARACSPCCGATCATAPSRRTASTTTSPPTSPARPTTSASPSRPTSSSRSCPRTTAATTRFEGYGKTSKLVYDELTTDHPIDLTPLAGGQLLHGPHRPHQQRRRVQGRRRPGRGRAHRGHQQAGRRHRAHLRAARRSSGPMAEGVELLNAIQDVYLDDVDHHRLTARRPRSRHGVTGSWPTGAGRRVTSDARSSSASRPESTHGGRGPTDRHRRRVTAAEPLDRVDHPLRRRLRRRHAAHRRPLHQRQRAVRQRPGHAARLPGRDPGPRRHAGRRLGLPGPHLRPRHHHAGRRAQRAGGHEPGRAAQPSSTGSSRAARSSSTPTPSRSATSPRPATTPTRSTTAASRATRSTRCR